MKNILRMFSALLVLAITVVTPGWAAEGDSNFTNVVASGDITFNSALLALGRVGGASSISSSSTFLSTGAYPYSFVSKRVGVSGSPDSSNGGTILHNGYKGQVITFLVTALISGGTWIITPDTKTGFSKVTFDAVGDSLSLLYLDDTSGWIVLANNSVVVAQ